MKIAKNFDRKGKNLNRKLKLLKNLVVELAIQLMGQTKFVCLPCAVGASVV